MSNPDPNAPLPARFIDIKREIAATYPDFERNIIHAWGKVTEELNKVTAEIIKKGGNYIPQIKFSQLKGLSADEVVKIKERGCIVLRDVVEDAEAIGWKSQLEKIIKENPEVEGRPLHDPQFYELYWTKPQVRARAHPNVLSAMIWLNNLYHKKGDTKLDGVDLSTPLTYSDRIRLRRPGAKCSLIPPHIDGGTIERWEDPALRKCFDAIFSGNWEDNDPYDLEGRLNANNSSYGRPNQSSIFRTFQGWMSLSETGPGEGSMDLFPNVNVAMAYFILRPFFRPLVPIDSPEIYDADNWQYDISTAEFPGIVTDNGGGYVAWPSPHAHPHLRLEKTMTSVPKVYPGDMVFWHCDVIHAVEEEHEGLNDSSVIYIPAMPLTPQNKAFVEKHREIFLRGDRPVDFPKGISEAKFTGFASLDDISTPLGKQAMGF